LELTVAIILLVSSTTREPDCPLRESSDCETSVNCCCKAAENALEFDVPTALVICPAWIRALLAVLFRMIREYCCCKISDEDLNWP
jgi:hypothetical protein